MLCSIGGKGRDASFLRPLEGFAYEFAPVERPTLSNSPYDTIDQLLELVVPAESGDCPDLSLRHADGHFRTGDLFQEVLSGHYLARGRDDDWIKTENCMRCDARCVLLSVSRCLCA